MLGPKSIVLFRVLRTWNLTRVACTGVVFGNLHALADTKRVNHMANRRSRNAWLGKIRHASRLLGPGGLRGPHGEVDMGHLAERLDGGRFQLISTASIHGVLGDLGCGFANTRALRVWLHAAFFYLTGGWKVLKDSSQICRNESRLYSLKAVVGGMCVKRSRFSTHMRSTRNLANKRKLCPNRSCASGSPLISRTKELPLNHVGGI